MLKKLLQNQQNLKADGIYSCTGIYFFKSAIYMSTLTHDQKETIRKLKLKISDTTFTIAKIQDLSPIEQNLLKQALNYVVVDKVGDYEGRFMELHKYK